MDYSSLIVVRLQGICDDCNATIPIETSHTVLSCRSAAHLIDDTEVMDLLGVQFFGWLPSNRSYPFSGLAREVGAAVTISSFIGSDHFFGIRPLDVTDVSTMAYVVRGWYERDRSKPGTSIAASMYNCTMETSRLEADVQCKKGACGVSRMRRSTRDRRPPNHTIFHGGSLQLLHLGNFSLLREFMAISNKDHRQTILSAETPRPMTIRTRAIGGTCLTWTYQDD